MSQPPYSDPPPPGWGAPPPPPPGGFPPPTPWPPAPAGQRYDQVSGLVLPAGTELASVGRRVGAWFLAIPLAIVTLGVGYVIWGLVVWNRGQTPALQVLGMRVWRPDSGRRATFWWMALREIVGRFVEGVLGLVTEVVSFILFCARGDHKALHDLIAGTVVLRDPGKVLA